MPRVIRVMQTLTFVPRTDYTRISVDSEELTFWKGKECVLSLPFGKWEAQAIGLPMLDFLKRKAPALLPPEYRGN